MKSKALVLTAVIATALTVGGCDQVKKLVGGKPEGQVVATVNGEEITALELRQEMGNFASRDPEAVKRAQQAALERLVMRRLIVQKAKDEKLDKSADYAMQMRRGEQSLLTQLYQRKITASIAVPSAEEGATYVASHPDQFSGRQLLVVEQVIAAPNSIPAARFGPIKTFEELRSTLDAEKVRYQSNVATIDTLTLDPRAWEQIKKLPAGEIFAINQGGATVFNRIVEARPAPFQGDAATKYAVNVLRNQRAQEAVNRQFEVMRKSSDNTIVYNDAYKPQAPAAKAAAPAAK